MGRWTTLPRTFEWCLWALLLAVLLLGSAGCASTQEVIRRVDGALMGIQELGDLYRAKLEDPLATRGELEELERALVEQGVSLKDALAALPEAMREDGEAVAEGGASALEGALGGAGGVVGLLLTAWGAYRKVKGDAVREVNRARDGARLARGEAVVIPADKKVSG